MTSTDRSEPDAPRAGGRRAAAGAAALAGVVLLVVYLATLAPDVTFWDAGEFIAAAKSLGIPHPPGTPLVMLLHNVWAKVLFFVPFAVATNSVSAITTAAAGAFSVALLLESLAPGERARHRWHAVAGALCAGGMSTVWMNATETEVYSVALALSVIMLWAGQRAGRRDSLRWRALTAYLMVLSVPLHLSALVAAPAAAWLASTTADGAVQWDMLTGYVGLFLLTMGLGKMSAPIAAAGVVVMALAPLAPRAAPLVRRALRRPAPEAIPNVRGRGWGTMLALAGAGAVAASAVLVMLVRARFDPGINQGNPSTWHALADVIARRQYDVPGMWPRNAPFWLQVANMFQYADWQVALALAPGVMPSVGRVLMTVLFAGLGAVGATAQWHADRRGWWALLILFLCGSLGIVVYVNFHAGPSFGYGLIPDNAVREARDRDYFYYLGFWTWGLWAGWGAVTLAERWRTRTAAGVVVAALPIALNWSVVSRRGEPGADLPRVFGEAILGSTPSHAVLIVAGDNDSYPLWYLQQVHGFRRDVTIVTSPLLNALWYQAEVKRRAALLANPAPVPEVTSAQLVARNALAQGRPLAVSVLMPASERNQLADGWSVHGLVYVATGKPVAATDGSGTIGAATVAAARAQDPTVDSTATRAWRDWVARWQRGRQAPLAIDPSDRYYLSLLSCPAQWLAAGRDPHRLASLDSLCNRR